MINFLSYALISFSPLFLITFGTLISEYAGVTAVFADGIINLTAFLFFAFSLFSGNLAAGAAAALSISVVLMYAFAVFAQRTQANPFLVGLSVNLFASGLSSLLSSLWFGTRSVAAEYLTGTNIFNASSVRFSRYPASVLCLAASTLIIVFLYRSAWGLRTRVVASNGDLLQARKIPIDRYRSIAWCLSALCAGIGGIIYVLKLSAFVPNISAGKGWIALAAVFLGNKNIAKTAAALSVFTAAEYAAAKLQLFPNGFPPSLLTSLPYAAALILFVLLPQEKKRKS